MVLFLRALFLLVLVSMLWVTSWASVRCPLFAVPRDVFAHPWFVAIMLLGNIAMSSYCLAELWRTPRDASLAELLTRRHDGPGRLGPALAALGLAVIFLALPRP